MVNSLEDVWMVDADVRMDGPPRFQYLHKIVTPGRAIFFILRRLDIFE